MGLVLAMAGNAIGLGNLLRFPVQAAQNGGGAFMIPYLVALLFLGLPLMWVEWSMGRWGGARGQGTPPGIFELILKSRWGRYLGLLGLWIPLTVGSYYVFITSWTLAYSIFSLFGSYEGITDRAGMGEFLGNYIAGDWQWLAIGIFCVTVLINMIVSARGIAGGIEKWARLLMPTFVVFAILLMARIFTLGAPVNPEWTVSGGLGFIWNPNFEQLGNPSIWLAAAGQVFFTLSIGMGAILCYASYIRPDDDVALSGVATASFNEIAEVIIGGSLAIPLAFMFFGPAGTAEIAQGGAFDLAFYSLPLVFQKLPLGNYLGTVWFLLLFFAAMTSTIAISQPVIALMRDGFGWSPKKAAIAVWSALFAFSIPTVLGNGYLDELDFWGATFALSVGALIEIILWAYVLGPRNALNELRRGAKMKVGGWFMALIAVIAPVGLVTLLISWFFLDALPIWMMEGVAPEQVPWRWAARIVMFASFLMLGFIVARMKIDHREPGGAS
jgi:NSS family neurotransmitter:Na+ symporter